MKINEVLTYVTTEMNLKNFMLSEWSHFTVTSKGPVFYDFTYMKFPESENS